MQEEFIILINGFDNYAVSNYGNVKNIITNKPIKLVENQQGYLCVALCQNNIKKSFRVHRLVAYYFIGDNDNKPYVNHKDGNKLNNKITNLEWCTASENTIHAQNTELKCDNKPILVTNLNTGEQISYFSIGECGKMMSINRGSIHRVLNGQRKTYKGYRFEYI